MNLKRKYGHQNPGPDTGSTESREDYLACIFELIAKRGYARVMDIVDSLSVTEPSASAMITRLAKNEYIKREKYRGFTLTKTGRAVAHGIHLRRRTLMIFLQGSSAKRDRTRRSRVGTPLKQTNAESSYAPRESESKIR